MALVGAATTAALVAWLRPPRAALAVAAKDPAEDAVATDGPSSVTTRADYQSVVNVAAGVVTLSAGALGIFGITAGLAVALLRNAPEAVATASLAAGAAVLLGVVSAFLPANLTVASRPRAVRVIASVTALLAVAALLTTGLAFTARAVPTQRGQALWWLFLGGIGALLLVTAVVVSVRGAEFRLKALAVLASLTVFGVAVLCIVVLAAGETRTAARPAVSAVLTFTPATTSTAASGVPGRTSAAAATARGSFVLQVTVKSVGMTSDERYLVAVHRVDRTNGAKNVTEIYRTYVGPDGSGTVSYAFTLPLASDPTQPWLGVSATLQRAGGPTSDPADHCAVDARDSTATGSTCALVYADPALAAS